MPFKKRTLRFDSKTRTALKRAFPAEFPRILRAAKSIQAYEITYLSDGLKVKGFLVLPKRGGRLPCVIYNRGGGDDFGVLGVERVFTRLAEIASWGYVVIASQYRGCGGSEGHDEYGGKDLNDVLKLRTILHRIPSADVKRIGVIGHSRGGMMTYLLLSKHRWIRAAVSVAGLADFVRMVKKRKRMASVAKLAFGGSRRELKKRSAVLFARRFSKKTPILLLHGTADWRVTPLDSIDMARELLRFRVPHRLVLFEGSDHSLTEHRAEMYSLIRGWLDRFVKHRGRLPELRPHGN